MWIWKIFKEEESIEILKIHGLLTNIEEYQKIYGHIWRKLKSRIETEKHRWNKKFNRKNVFVIYKSFPQHTNNDWQEQSPDSMIF